VLHAGYELPLNLMPNNDGISWINVKDGKAVPISYANGIEMVTGRDKGHQLLDLLGRLKLRYDNIVPIDDGESNIKSLRNAVPVHGINYYGFHYKGVPKGAITDTEKAESHATWLLWSKLMEVGHEKRWARWEEKDKAGCGM